MYSLMSKRMNSTADPRRAGEEKAADGLAGDPQPGPRTLDRGDQGADGVVLSENDLLEPGLQVLELGAVGGGNALRGDARHLGHDFFDVGGMDFLAAGSPGQPHEGAGLVHHVDGLVGEIPVVQVLGREVHGGLEGAVRVLDPVVLLVARAQPLENLQALADRRLGDFDLLEAGRAGAHDGVDLIDEQNRLRPALELGDHPFQALLEVAPELGSGEHAAQVERIDVHLLEQVGHLAPGDFLRQPFGQGGLAHARVADEDGIVLAPPAKHLHGALDFDLAADQRVQLALPGQPDQVGRVHLQGVVLAPPILRTGASFRRLALLVGGLGDLVRNVVEHIQPRDPLRTQEELGMRVFLQENGGQNVADRNLGFVGRTGMADRALDDPLETDRLLQNVFAAFGDLLDLFFEEGFQVPQDGLDVAPAVLDDLDPALLVEDGEQDVFDADVFVPALLGFAHRKAQGGGQFLADHGVILFPWCI